MCDWSLQQILKSVTVVNNLRVIVITEEQKLHNISRSGQKILLFFDVSDKPSSENDKMCGKQETLKGYCT